MASTHLLRATEHLNPLRIYAKASAPVSSAVPPPHLHELRETKKSVLMADKRPENCGLTGLL